MSGVRTLVSRHRYVQGLRYNEDSEGDLMRELAGVRQDENGRPTLLFEGGVVARRGDWVLRTVEGVVLVLDERSFKAAFEVVYA